MKRIEEVIEVDGYNWMVILTTDKQLMLAFEIPKEYSTWKNDPLWFSFDPEDDYNQPEWSADPKNMPKDFSIFKLVNAVFGAIRKIVSMYDVDFFYFNANADKKGKVYHLLSQRLINEMGGNWMYQVFDEYWFYLTKLDANTDSHSLPHRSK